MKGWGDGSVTLTGPSEVTDTCPAKCSTERIDGQNANPKTIYLLTGWNLEV